MSVLTFQSDEYFTFPPILQEYASYMVTIQGKSEKTVCEYLLDIRTFFRHYKMTKSRLNLPYEELEQLEISDLTLDTIREIKQENIISFLMYCTVTLKNNTATRSRKLSSLRSFFTFLHSKRRYIDDNPAMEIDSPKKKKALPKHLTLEECITLLETVRSDKTSKTSSRDFCIISLFLNTGMRLSELVSLNLTSFDSELTMVRVLGKGNKERTIYLNDASRRVLEEYIRTRLDPKYIHTSENAFFLSTRQTRISPKTVQYVVYKYLRLAGFAHKGLSVHKLRHTAATLMFQSGNVDIRVLKDILGHEQLNTTQIYTHVVDRNMQEAMTQNPLANITIRRREMEE